MKLISHTVLTLTFGILSSCGSPFVDDPYALFYNWKGHEHPVATFTGDKITFEYYSTSEKFSYTIENVSDAGFDMPVTDQTIRGEFLKGRETKACGHYQLYDMKLTYPDDGTSQVYRGEIKVQCE